MSWAELVEAAEQIRAAALGFDPGLADLALAGIGWATVEGERAIRELDALLARGPGHPAPSWSPAARDAALGARTWIRNAVDGEPVSIVVLEPDTEGRLAAALARFGEGVAVVYLGIGPAGAGRLVRGGPVWGPHVIVLIATSAPGG